MQTNSTKQTSRTKTLLPLIILIILEVFVYGWLAISAQLQISSSSVLISSLLFASGIIPAILKPTRESMLAGSLIALICGLTIIPLEQNLLPTISGTHILSALTPLMITRLAVGSLIAPVSIHLASRFPSITPLSHFVIPAAYGISVLLYLVFLISARSASGKLAFTIDFIWFFVILLSALGILIRNTAKNKAEEFEITQQARILLFIIFLSLSPMLLRPIIFFLSGWAIPFNFVLTAVIIWPVGIVYIVFRHDLFGIDAFIRRTFAYTFLTLIVLILYLSLTLALTGILSDLLPNFNRFATLLSLIIAAVLFEPLRKWSQRLIDGFLYPDRLNFQNAMIQSGQALSRINSSQEIYNELSIKLPQRLGAQWAALTLTPQPETPGPQTSNPAWNGHLMVGDRSLGRFWLGPRKTIQTYDRSEQIRLQSLLQQAALAVAYADTIEQLNEFNEELEQRVEIRTRQILGQQRQMAVLEERQRLAREMHDSISQALFSINLSTRALKKLARQDIETTIVELGELEKTAQQASSEMRTLLKALRNSEEKSDLIEKIKFHCQDLERKINFIVTLNTPEELLLPVRIEHEIFQMIRESLHNILKHSGVKQAECNIEKLRSKIQIQIIDKGKGFNPKNIESGHYGLKGLHERTAVLQGDLQINSKTRQGTQIDITIPLEKETNSHDQTHTG